MRHERSYDGLRAVAVTSVVMIHTNIITVVIHHSKYSLLPGGWAGVEIFFVLSGYLISRVLITELSAFGSIDFRKFYMRRLLRLVPASTLLLTILFFYSAYQKANRLSNFEDILLSLTYTMNWAKAFSLAPGGGGLVAHTWSLADEEQFYIIWPFALMALTRLPKKWALGLVLALIILVIAWRSILIARGVDNEFPNRTYFGFDAHADPLLLGCLLAFLENEGNTVRYKLLRFAFIPIIMLVFVLVRSWPDGNPMSFGIILTEFSAAWIIVASSQAGVLQRFLCLRLLVYTGKISYGWYLWHFPALWICAQIPVSAIGEVAIAISSSYLIAAASYHFVETRFLKIKRRYGHIGGAA